ncbi:MAG: hypothetical protein ACRENK_01170 [Gemmatimonadaceae bacterium]
MRVALAIGYILGAALLGCGSDRATAPPFEPPVVPALESVPFALLGPGKVAFERLDGAEGYGAIYIIDATAGTSAHIFDNKVTDGPNMSPDGRRLVFSTYTGERDGVR